MSFGGLLGSLYGDLPAPKSGPIPSAEVLLAPTSKDGCPSTDASTAFAVEAENRNATGAPSVFQGKSQTPKPPDPQALLPPATRRRARPPPVVATVKRMKESTVLCAPPASASTLRPKSSMQQESAPATTLSAASTPNLTVHSAGAAAAPPPPSESLPSDGPSKLLPQKIINEYDPTVPNSYDDYVKERVRERRRQEESRRQQQEMERLREEQRRILPAASSASLAISGDEAWQRRKQMSAALFGSDGAVASAQPPPAKPLVPPLARPPVETPARKKAGFAQKMLEKMGWKQGEGLGREKQGIVAPLVARKTDKRSGIIVQGGKQPPPRSVQPAAETAPPAPLEDATRVLLLTNMVGRGDADDELESETAEEGAKYGNLLAVKVVELPSLPDDECVRIFCEYETTEDAIRAFGNFNNRLFGGRNVRAQFYNEKRYTEGDLST